jgi:hypothetical protein
MLMIEDGVTAIEAAIRPMDVAELLAQSLGEERRP